MLKLQLIVGSTRPGRAADLVLPWLTDRIRSHGGFELQVLDLREWPLPLFEETFATIGDIKAPTYSAPVVREWNEVLKTGDAYVVLTTEYNHSIPGALKNALDNVFVSWALRNKPLTTVGYSGGPIAGARAVEHLAHIAIEAEAVPLRNAVLIGQVQQAFQDGVPVNPGTDAALQIALDDLAWMGEALRAARAAGELPPAPFRRPG